ncbi:amino acid-binding protein [Geoanaerobacter pelophilus]|uniref:Amino acid-binding protein n=1 Tax=Geoanaerobacter pelophilus TaxID=60036 RepID=A0ABQ0MGW0_9BACT|nr:ACT domain-containing protein [Geoanaerobacter pelophilus]GAW66335.1 amino acid-binding protein [Geoanaerobacter pelophilus]
MHVEQISIFIENKFGRLAEVTRILGEAGVNIRTLSLADTSDFGILRLIVNDAEKAKSVLKDRGFTVSKTEVVAVEIPDRPGGLADILQVLDASGINVEYMYAFVERCGENAVMIFRFDETQKAIESLTAKNFNVLPGERLYSM